MEVGRFRDRRNGHGRLERARPDGGGVIIGIVDHVQSLTLPSSWCPAPLTSPSSCNDDKRDASRGKRLQRSFCTPSPTCDLGQMHRERRNFRFGQIIRFPVTLLSRPPGSRPVEGKCEIPRRRRLRCSCGLPTPTFRGSARQNPGRRRPRSRGAICRRTRTRRGARAWRAACENVRFVGYPGGGECERLRHVGGDPRETAVEGRVGVQIVGIDIRRGALSPPGEEQNDTGSIP